MKSLNELKVIITEIDKESIQFTRKTRLWCKLPYYGHKKGCPNYDKNPLCPSIYPYSEHIIDNYNHFYLIYIPFNLYEYKMMRKQQHPNWSEKQLENVLYYQGSVKKLMKNSIKQLLTKNNVFDNFFIFFSGSGMKGKTITAQKHIPSMEAAGINVLRTLKNNNIDFEVKPKTKIVFTSLLCLNKKLRGNNKK